MDILRKLRQKCVYWSIDSTDEYGTNTFDEAIEMQCRWENVTELFIDSTGASIPSKSIVYTEFDVEEGGWLFEGELTDLPSVYDDPVDLVQEGALEIKKFNKLPDLKAEEFLRRAYL